LHAKPEALCVVFESKKTFYGMASSRIKSPEKLSKENIKNLICLRKKASWEFVGTNA